MDVSFEDIIKHNAVAEVTICERKSQAGEDILSENPKTRYVSLLSVSR